MIDVGIIVGSTRPGRRADTIGRWVLDQAWHRGDARYELIDLAEEDLPLYDEPLPAARGEYAHDHTRRWSERVRGFDAFVVVSPEYNHGIPAVLKNALDLLYVEWNDKAVGFVSYGSAGGVRAVEHLRGVVGELRMADVRAQVFLSTLTDLDEVGIPRVGLGKEDQLDAMLGQLVAWGTALVGVRT